MLTVVLRDFQIVTWALLGILFPFIISLLGILGNITNIAVFRRQGLLADNCTPSLVSMAVFDLGHCVLMFVNTAVNISRDCGGMIGDHYWGNIIEVTTQVLKVPKTIFTQLTILITTYLAFERMVSVTFPFQVKFLFNPKRSYVVIALIFAFTMVAYFPTLSKHYIYSHESFGGSTSVYLWLTMMFGDNVYTAEDIFNNMVVRPLCILLVIVFNIIIIVKVTTSQDFKKTKKTSSKDKSAPSSIPDKKNEKNDEKKITVKSQSANSKRGLKFAQMMVTLCVIFVACYMPALVDSFFSILTLFIHYDFMDSKTRESMFVVRGIIAPFLELFNASINIVLYYTMSKKFKDELRLICVKQ